MASNQIPNENQAVNSPPLPLMPNSQMMNSDDHVNEQVQQQQQPDLVNSFPYPNNQSPTFAIPNLTSSTNDLFAREFSQFSRELRNQREHLSFNLTFQHLQAVNSIMAEQYLNRDILVENYVSNLLGLLREKENELVTTNHAYFELESQLQAWQLTAAEKDATVAQLNQQLQMINNEPGAASSSSSSPAANMVDFNCRMCGQELSCVLILPCRHLCSCLACEAYVYSCPVCETVKESSVEVSWPVMKKQGADKKE